MREKVDIKKLKMGGGRGRESERENKNFPFHFRIHQSVCHMGWWREREKKIMSPHIPLSSELKFILEKKKGPKRGRKNFKCKRGA